MRELEERVAALERERDALVRRQAAERLATVGPVISAATHELRNPLSAALGNLEIAIEEVGGGTMPRAELLEVLGDALLGAQAVRAFVADLAVLVTRDPGPSAVGDAVGTAARLAAHPIRNFGTLEVDLPDEELRVALSSSSFVWLLLDLLRGAIGAGARGSAGVLSLRAVRDGDGVLVAVRGPGDPTAGPLLPFVRSAALEAGGRVTVDPVRREVGVWLPGRAGPE